MGVNDTIFTESILKEYYDVCVDDKIGEEFQYQDELYRYCETETSTNSYIRYSLYDSGNTYSEFADLYAQDIMGYSDETINDAFEGDPAAYWNID